MLWRLALLAAGAALPVGEGAQSHIPVETGGVDTQHADVQGSQSSAPAPATTPAVAPVTGSIARSDVSKVASKVVDKQLEHDRHHADQKKEVKVDLTNYMRALAVILGFLVVGVLWFERWIWRTDWQDVGEAPQADQQGQEINLRHIFHGFTSLAAPYWGMTTKGKWFAAGLGGFVVLELFTSYVHNKWRQQFWDNFEDGSAQYFVRLMTILIVIISVEMLAGVYSKYTRWLLYIDWRASMTEKYVDEWLDNKSYAEMNRMRAVDNPDQRVQEDVSIYTESSISLSYDFCHKIGHLLLFLPLLFMLSPDKAFGIFYCPGWLFYMVGLYAMAGTFGAHFLGHQLIPITFAKQRREADFRYELVEVRDHAEAIAMLGGEETMQDRIGKRFKNFRGAWWHYMQINKRLMYFKHFFGTVNWLVPFCILAPSYFAKELTLGELFQLIHVVGKVESSLDWIINAYEPISDWRATADRLLLFQSAVEDHKQPELGAHGAPPAGCAVDAEGLHCRLPDGTELWTCKKLTLPTGWVLLDGPEGVGKTTLLKMLAGLWPAPGATVRLAASRFFVPEDPFVPASTLREALRYPGGGETPDGELLETLRSVGLQRLADAGLDHREEWTRGLSLGEKQRLTAAQILSQPPPTTLFLDEAFSHLDADTAASLIGLLQTRLPGTNVVHVAHDVETLRPLHSVHMRCEKVKDELVVRTVGVAAA